MLPDAKLAMFGDVFATPSWLPGNNVFSIGDVLIWVGLAWLLWRTCRRALYLPRHAAWSPPVAGRPAEPGLVPVG